MWFETLYKTSMPAQLEAAEYYQPMLADEVRDNKRVYFVSEKHGWFDGEGKRAVHHTPPLSPEEGFASLSDAESRYIDQIQQRAREGFVHSFSVDPMADPPIRYRLIQPL